MPCITHTPCLLLILASKPMLLPAMEHLHGALQTHSGLHQPMLSTH